jgi:hypothetical protein
MEVGQIKVATLSWLKGENKVYSATDLTSPSMKFCYWQTSADSIVSISFLLSIYLSPTYLKNDQSFSNSACTFLFQRKQPFQSSHVILMEHILILIVTIVASIIVIIELMKECSPVGVGITKGLKICSVANRLPRKLFTHFICQNSWRRKWLETLKIFNPIMLVTLVGLHSFINSIVTFKGIIPFGSRAKLYRQSTAVKSRINSS